MPAPSRSVRRQRQPGRRCRSKEPEAQQSELLPCQPGTPAQPEPSETSSCGAAPALLPGLSPPRARAQDLQHSQPGQGQGCGGFPRHPVGDRGSVPRATDAIPKSRAVIPTQRCPCLGTGAAGRQSPDGDRGCLITRADDIGQQGLIPAGLRSTAAGRAAGGGSDYANGIRSSQAVLRNSSSPLPGLPLPPPHPLPPARARLRSARLGTAGGGSGERAGVALLGKGSRKGLGKDSSSPCSRSRALHRTPRGPRWRLGMQ